MWGCDIFNKNSVRTTHIYIYISVYVSPPLPATRTTHWSFTRLIVFLSFLPFLASPPFFFNHLVLVLPAATRQTCSYSLYSHVHQHLRHATMDRSKLDAAYGDYCQQYHDNPIAMNVLQRFLDDRPVFQPPIDLLPVEEYEQRLDLIMKIEKRLSSYQPEFRINAATFSLFMIMSLPGLKEVASSAVSTYDKMVVRALGNLPQLIRSCKYSPLLTIKRPCY